MLDEIVQLRRNAKAAKRLLTRLLKKQGCAPKRTITDKLRWRGKDAGDAASRASLTQGPEQWSREFPLRKRLRELRIHRRFATVRVDLLGLAKSFGLRNRFVPSRRERSTFQIH